MEDRRNRSSNRPSRYKIEETETSEEVALRFPELAGQKIFVVWDMELDRRVPFGNHGDREAAQRHVDRLEARDAG